MIKRARMRPAGINIIKYFKLNLRCQPKNNKGTTRPKFKIEPTTTPFKLGDDELI